MLLLNYNILGTLTIVYMFKKISGLKFIIKLFCYRYWLDLIDGLCSLFYFALAYVLIISLYCVVLQVIWLMHFS